MPERKRIVRFEIVFSCIPFLLRLSQIVEPEPEPHPRPPRIRLKINYGFRTLSPSAVSPTNPDLTHKSGMLLSRRCRIRCLRRHRIRCPRCCHILNHPRGLPAAEAGRELKTPEIRARPEQARNFLPVTTYRESGL